MNNENSFESPVLSAEFLKRLKQESDFVFGVCKKLNSVASFKDVLEKVSDKELSFSNMKAEYILMWDYLRVYHNLLKSGIMNNAIELKSRFVLIYLYEKVQESDMIEKYSLSKLNSLLTTESFKKNAQLVQNTVFFKPSKSMEEAYILPSVLNYLRNENEAVVIRFFSNVTSGILTNKPKFTGEEEAYLKEQNKKIINSVVTGLDFRMDTIPPDDSLEKVLEELNELIGLEEIKKNVNDLTNFLKIQKVRKEKGFKTTHHSLHTVFMGPPGTGKTTVARLLGRIYKHLGYLEKGHLIETDRSGMVAGYVGQTAIKTTEIINSAQGGVLFIDEAYSLTSGGFNDFGNEAVEIVLKNMEDKRDKFVVIVAGYMDEMERFIQSNPGLQSRFNRYLKFEHYHPEALMKIFGLYVKKADFVLTKDAQDKFSEIVDRLYEKRYNGFGNARAMRNFFEKIIERQANRIVSLTPLNEEILKTLTEEDIPEILKTVKEIIQFEDTSPEQAT